MITSDEVELIAPIAMEEGCVLRFVKVVELLGAGVVTKIIE